MILLTKLHCLSGPLVDFPFHINGDLSQRMMAIIESMVARVEVASIDEAFLDLTG
ncbi:impB/mucB/samB family protein, partial [Pseudomonas savastanoi pv. glycinea str. race 4]